MNGSPHRLDLAVERARRAVGWAASWRSTRTPTDTASSTTCAGASARRAGPGSSRDACSTRGRGRTCSPGWRGKPGRGPRPATLDRGAATVPSRGDGPRATPPIDGSPAASSCSSRSSSSGCRGWSSRPTRPGSSAALLLGAMLVGSLQVLADEHRRRRGRRPDRVADPAGGGGRRLPRCDPARAVRAAGSCPALVRPAPRRPRRLALEVADRSAGRRGPATADRTGPAWSRCLLVAFLAFTGVAAIVPGGLAGARRSGRGRAAARERLLVLAVARRAHRRSCSATARPPSARSELARRALVGG